MTMPRRLCLILAVTFGCTMWAGPGALADDAPGADDNTAVAVNTEDGASIFRLAFSVRIVANGVVDQTNSAYALASCTDCQTVALAFQVVLVWGDPNVVVPKNRVVALNEQCTECVTYASATQIVLGFDGPAVFTDEGRRRLTALYQSLRDLEDQVGELTLAQLHAAVTAAKAELIAILEEDLVPASEISNETKTDSNGVTTTSTTTQPTSTSTQPTTSTTSPGSTTTTSTRPSTSSTSTTAPSSTTTTTTRPDEPTTTSTTAPG